MMGRMMVSAAPSAMTSELSTLRALGAADGSRSGPGDRPDRWSLGREDMRRALEGLAECIALITALTPLEAAVAAAIEDL